MSFWSDLGNTIINSFDPANLFGFGHGNGASSSATGTGSILGDTWDKFKNGNSNDVNWQIAQENLGYQKERARIEDERYAEETAYNRAWAEEERDYNRALQERLFEREDTALTRQAEQLSALGINPASQQLNGLGAGAQVSSAAAPSASGRVAETPQNNYQQIPGGIEGILTSLSGLANTVNGVATGQYSRDSLALENDRKYLENLVYARKNGIDYVGPEVMNGPNYRKYHWINKSTGEEYYKGDDWLEARGSELSEDANKNREYSSKKKYGVFDWESPQTTLLKSLGSLDFQSLAENLLTNVANAGNWVNGNLKDFSKDMDNNAIMKFIKKFFAF